MYSLFAGRRYEDEEEARRKHIFSANVKRIEMHNYLHSKGLKSFKLGITPFTDMVRVVATGYCFSCFSVQSEKWWLFWRWWSWCNTIFVVVCVGQGWKWYIILQWNNTLPHPLLLDLCALLHLLLYIDYPVCMCIQYNATHAHSLLVPSWHFS